MVVRKQKKVYPDKQVFRFRSLSKHLEDDFTLELRVASHLGLDYPIEIDKCGGHMIRIRLTPHNHIADQPKYEPERRADASLSDMFRPNIKLRPESCILYYQVLDIPVPQSEASMNVPFYHAARDESVGDLLCKLKSK
ncbi:hypothetical protein MKW94_025916, partial [Papaver nudicaule]|nr:hypothetical protein [Papaver nudicaule]